MQESTVTPSLSILLTCVAIFVAASLNGCAINQPMKVALTEMGTTSDSEYGVYGLRMTRAVNVTGLGAEEVVGTMTTDPDKWSIREQFARWSPTRHDLPDSMTPRITSGPSMIVERRFCKKSSQGNQCVDKATIDACNKTPTSKECEGIVTITDLTELRDTLQTYQVKIAEAAHLELKNVVLNGTLGALSNDVAKNNEILKPLQILYPEDNLIDRAAVEAALKDVGIRLAANILSKPYDTIKKILSKPGIIVTNWERETALSGSAHVADAKGAVGNTRKIGGFLILGEPRITSLQLGNDLVARQIENNDDKNKYYGTDRLFTTGRNYITHYQLRAKYVVFSESYQSAFQTSLQADVGAIIQKLGPMVVTNIGLLDNLKDIQIKVNAAYAAVTAGSESGVIDASSGYVEQRPFSLRRNEIAKSVEDEMKRSEDTVPIISMRAALDEFIKNAEWQAGNNK